MRQKFDLNVMFTLCKNFVPNIKFGMALYSRIFAFLHRILAAFNSFKYTLFQYLKLKACVDNHNKVLQ